MNVDIAMKIGDFIGRFLSLENNPQLHRARKFLCIRVSLNTQASLNTGCYIERRDGHRSWVQFKYERIPTFCYRCGHLDHIEHACPQDESTSSHTCPHDPSLGPRLRVGASSCTKLGTQKEKFISRSASELFSVPSAVQSTSEATKDVPGTKTTLSLPPRLTFSVPL